VTVDILQAMVLLTVLLAWAHLGDWQQAEGLLVLQTMGDVMTGVR
jgi:hypothetical protein